MYRKHRVALGLQPSEDQCVFQDDYNDCSDIASSLPVSTLDEVSVGVMTAELAETRTDATQPELLSSTRPQQRDPSIERIIQNAEFLLMLTEGKQVSQVALDEVIKGCRKICEQTVSQIKQRVICALGHAGINTADIPGLEVSLCSTPDPFEKIDTAYLREKFYKEYFNYMVGFISTLIMYCKK